MANEHGHIRRRKSLSDPRKSTSNRREVLRRVETTFESFPDGTIIEAVRTCSTTDLQLAIWSQGRVSVQPNFLRGGQLYVPPRIAPGLATALRYPIADFHSVFVASGKADKLEVQTSRYLFYELDDLVNRLVTVDAQLRPLVVAYVCFTWLADRFTQAPYLSIVGPLGSGKTQLLRFLSCCCRRAVLLSDLTIASLYSLTDSVAPTLLIDEADFGRDTRSRELLRLLRAGHTAGGVTLRGGRAYNLFSPKVICSRTPIPDAALASRTVEISMSRCTEDHEFPLNISAVSRVLQPLLLRFRLRNYHQDLSVKTNLGGLSPRSRDLARALAGPFFDCPDIQELIVEKIRLREPDAMSRQSDEPELLVLEAFFTNIHTYTQTYVTVGTVSQWTNALLQFRGEHPRFKPRGIGPILRQLGFSTRTLGSRGTGMWITTDVRDYLHR